MNAIKEDCETNRHYDYPFLCGDNELKKLQYFYDHPKDYLLYQNEDQVVDFLVQDKKLCSSRSIKWIFKFKLFYNIIIIIIILLKE